MVFCLDILVAIYRVSGVSTRFLTVFLIFGFSGSGFCEIPVSKVQKAIGILLDCPSSSAGKAAGLAVLQFAGSTQAYRVEITLGYLPWSSREDLPTGSQLLLAAFVAGNLQEQIKKGSARPEPYAGALAVICVYRKLSEKIPDFRISQVEEFMALESKGRLRNYIASIR